MNYARAGRRLLLGVFCWRLLYVFIAPFDLVGDEAYYWDWSRRLDWSYISKPPLIAWINWASTSVFGATTWAVRLPAALMSPITMWAVGQLARRTFDERVSFWAMITWFAIPLSAGTGLVMSIDAPLVCLWSLSLLFTWRALEEPGPRWWIAAALLVGVGLLAKQLMAFYFIIAPLFLLASREDRHQLRTPWPYLVIVLPMLMFIPVLLWNAEHGWVTAAHTADHFVRPSPGPLATLGEFVFGQIVVFSPIIWIQFIWIFAALLRRFRTQDRRTRFLLFNSAIPVAIFFALSLRQRVNANWPAVFYLAAVPLQTAWGLGALSCGAKLDGMRQWHIRGIRLGFLFVFGAYSLGYVIPHTPLGGHRLDPTARLREWQATARVVDRMRAEQPRPETTIVVGIARQDAALFAFYCTDQPITYTWPGDLVTQYDIWPPPYPDKEGWDALIFARHKVDTSDSERHFDKIEDLGWIEIPLGPGGNRRYRVYRGSGIRYWPGVGGSHASSASDNR